MNLTRLLKLGIKEEEEDWKDDKRRLEWGIIRCAGYGWMEDVILGDGVGGGKRRY